MKKYSRNQLGSLTVLFIAMMQAGVVHAGNAAPGLQLDTGIAINPALGGACVGSTNPSVSGGPSTCNVSVAAPNTVTITSGNLIANAPNMAGISITGDASVTNTVNFSGTANGGSSSVGVNIANTAGHITLNVASGSTIAVTNGTTANGGAGVIGTGFTLGNAGSITGGTGGTGGGSYGKYGGAGVSGTGFTVNNSGSITGGRGGSGGIGKYGASGVTGSGFTLNNSGTITGGVGGAGSPFGAHFAAVTSTGGSTINNSGTISGGLANGGAGARQNAVNFSGGANKLVLEAGSVIIGNAVSTSGSTNGGDTLALGGNVNAVGNTFDLASIGGVAQFQGFQNFAKEGSSLWTLTGTGTSSWNVTAGTLHLADSFALTGDVTVASGATVSSDNAGITGQLVNGGTVSVATGKTLTVTGDFTNTGTFSPVVTNTGFGKLTASGIATLSGSTLFVDASALTSANTYGGTVNGVINATSISGTFASYSDNSALFNFTPEYTTTKVNLNIAAAGGGNVANDVSANNNTSGLGAASALDQIIVANPGGAIAALFVPLTTTKQVSDAVSQIVPQVAGVVSQAVTTNLGTVTRIVQSRQDGQHGKSSGDSFYGDQKFWFKPFGSWANQDDQNGVSGYKSNSYGMIFGADANLSDSNRVGAAFAYSKTDVDSKGVASQSADIDSYTALVYGSHSLNATTELNFQGGVGFHNTDGSRTISISGTNSYANSSYNSWSANVGTGVARTITLSEKTSLTPSIRMDYSRIRSDAYSESGAGVLNLNVDKNTSEALVLGVDGKLSHALSDRATFVGNFGIGYDLINDRSSLTSAFAGAPTVAFTTIGINPSPWLARGGFGVIGKVTETMEVSARYDFEVRENFDNQTASVKMRWMF